MRSVFGPLTAALIFVSLPCLAEDLPAPSGDPTVIGQVEHFGYGLVGPRGRFYVFGGIAMADYSDSAGTRRIVTLQHEDQISDANHDYYRELREGHRWAFSRKANANSQFAVWFQFAATDPAQKSKWQPFERATLQSPKEAQPSGPVPTGTTGGQVVLRPCCGR